MTDYRMKAETGHYFSKEGKMEEFSPTMYLRFKLKDQGKVLQQLWKQGALSIWVDVPMEGDIVDGKLAA